MMEKNRAGRGGSPPTLDPDSADRVFRTRTNFGMEVTPDFDPNKNDLAEVYEIVRYLSETATEGLSASMPSLDNVVNEIQNRRKSHGRKGSEFTAERVMYLLVILAAQQPPFIHAPGNVTVNSSQDTEVIHRFVAPSNLKPDLIGSAYRAAVYTICNVIAGAADRSSAWANWEKVLPALRSVSPVDDGYLKGRLDIFLKRLFLKSQKTDDEQHTANIRRINEILKDYLITPAIHSLKNDGAAIVLHSADLRNSECAWLKKCPDLIYYNNPDGLKDRYFALLRCLFSDRMHDFIEPFDALDPDSTPEETLHQSGSSVTGRLLYSSACERMTAIQFNIVQEISRLSQWYETRSSEEKKEKENREDLDILDQIRKQPNPVAILRNKPTFIPTKFVKKMMRGDVSVLDFCTFPDFRKTGNLYLSHIDAVYILCKDRKIAAGAIERASREFIEMGNGSTLLALERIFRLDEINPPNTLDYVPADSITSLKKLLRTLYFRRLPLLRRILIKIFSLEIKPEEIEAIRKKDQDMEKSLLNKRISAAGRQSVKSAKRQVRDLAKSRVRVQQTENRGPAKKLTREIVSLLESSWAAGKFPLREDVLSGLKGSSGDAAAILGFVDGGSADFSEILSILTHGGRIYAPRDYLIKNIASVKKKLSSTGMGGPDIRKEILLYLDKTLG